VVKITRNARTSNCEGGALPWAYAQTSRVRELLQANETALAAELNEAAGLDWTVYQAAPFFFVAGDPPVDEHGFLTVTATTRKSCRLVARPGASGRPPEPDYFFNVRSDTQHVVGIVKGRYRILQNEQAPAVLDQLVGSGALRYEAAGSLHRGARVFWLARLRAGADHELQTHVLLMNSHDGSTSLAVSVVAAHAATRTTLAWPIPNIPRTLTIRHTDSATEQALEARRVLQLASAYRAALLRTVDRRLATSLTVQEFTRFLETVVPIPAPRKKGGRTTNRRGITMAENTQELIRLAYFRNEALAPARGTLFAALLACQHYADHLSISRTTDDASPEENRFKRLTSEDNLGAKAFRHALGLLP
jgi:phage/plasmid-like protein (TIGR03299 family)